MTDDRSIERAARSWLEDGPTQAPDRVVEAALLEINQTSQERDWHVPWRTQPMTQTIRLLAGAAAIAVVVGGGMLILRPGNGPGVGGQATPTPTATASAASPTASGPLTACGLISEDEVKTHGGNPGLGAQSAASGTGAVTTCIFSTGGGDVIMRLTYTTPGGQVAFESAKNAPGVEVVTDAGTEAVFDPATATLYLGKGDAMVAIVAGTSADSSADRRVAATELARIIAARM